MMFDPVGGGQFKKAMNTILEMERQPIKGLQEKKKIQEAKYKLFQEFKTKFTGLDKQLADIGSFRKFRELKVDLGDGATLMGVTVDNERADPGSWEFQIDQVAKRTSVISNGFKDPEETGIGVGFVVCEVEKGSNYEVFIDYDESSLNKIAQKINMDKEAPVRAAVIKDSYDKESPYRMILTAKTEGEENRVVIPQFYFMDGSQQFYIDSERAAENAQIFVDGFPVDTDSNVVKDFFPGVNLTIKQSKEDFPFFVTISEDKEKISGKIKGFTDQLNAVLDFILKQNQVDESTDTKSMFTGDTGLTALESKIRNVLHEGYPVYSSQKSEPDVKYLTEFGFEFTKTGQIQLKEDRLKKALEKDFDTVAQVITGDDGMVRRLQALLGGYTRPGDGLLSLRDKSLKQRIKTIDDQILQKEDKMKIREQQLSEQFGRLSASVGSMQQQQQYLSSALGGGGGDMVSQLLKGA